MAKPEGVAWDEPFYPGYVPTEDEQMLLDRADAAHRFIKFHPDDVDRYEMLAAVIWPTDEMLEAQRTGGAGLESI